MEKEFVPYELAVKLKELGFDEPCFGYYTELKDFVMRPHLRQQDCIEGKFLAPTWQSAFRWFREKYQLHSTITSISQESWQWHIQKPGQQLGKLYDEDFYTYEEAELACLEKLIEIVEQKNEK
jgi:hypothetical protein